MNCVKKSKRIFSLLVCFMLIMSMMLPLMGVIASAASNKLDIIFVIDDTRSMKETDPDKLCSVAVKKFMDKMSTGADVRFGIATYSVFVEDNLAFPQEQAAIEEFANSKIDQGDKNNDGVYDAADGDDGKGTDAAVGLEWAMNQLESSNDPDRAKAVILVGDGANSFARNGADVRTEDESNATLQAAIQKAQGKGIQVYTLAINPTAENFRQYFENIATQTSGTAYEPKNVDEVDAAMGEIFTSLTGAVSSGGRIGPVGPDQPWEHEIEVPEDVFEMNLICDHQDPVEITIVDPAGNAYNKNSSNVVYKQTPQYTSVRISAPVAGIWKATYTSQVQQTIRSELIFHKDLVVKLTKNETDVEREQTVQYIATIESNGNTVSDDEELKAFTANLIVNRLNKKGDVEKTETIEMKVDNGKLVAEYAAPYGGKYEFYAEVSSKKSSIQSNVLEVDVKGAGPMPWWVIPLIALGVVILLVVLFIIIHKSRTGDGTGYIYGDVAVRIVCRQANDETMVFQQDKFNCEQVFVKKNTLSDLITAYCKRYRINSSSELDELTLNQFINSTMTEVTDKIAISGNKKKQIIIRIPVGYEMQVDGMEINKPKAIIFNSPEREVE
ncbi:MAG: VWA domain-containing protein, partial [Ruminococcaceae bacterium]|nr:VWA domain-containing protein [Oscillospiraceae bacterium]